MKINLNIVFFGLLVLPFISQGQGSSGVNEIDARIRQVFDSDLENYDTAWIDYRDYVNSILDDTSKERSKNAHLVMAFLELYKNHYDSASKHFKRSLQIDSNCYQCYIKLHWIYFYIKHDYKNTNAISKTAIKRFEELVSKDTMNAINWSRLYNMYGLREYDHSKLLKKRQDEVSLKRVTLVPNNPYYLWEHSFHCLMSEKEEFLRKAYELEPNASVYWDALANYYLERKNLEKCMKVIDEVESSEDHSGYWFQQKAYYLYKFGKLKEAQMVKQEAKKYGEDIIYK